MALILKTEKNSRLKTGKDSELVEGKKITQNIRECQTD